MKVAEEENGKTSANNSRAPREILRTAASRWYKARMESLSNYSTEDADIYVRRDVADAAQYAGFYGRCASGEGFAKVLRGVLIYAGPMTADEQVAVEQYVSENAQDAALTMQLALG